MDTDCKDELLLPFSAFRSFPGEFVSAIRVEFNILSSRVHQITICYSMSLLLSLDHQSVPVICRGCMGM